MKCCTSTRQIYSLTNFLFNIWQPFSLDTYFLKGWGLRGNDQRTARYQDVWIHVFWAAFQLFVPVLLFECFGISVCAKPWSLHSPHRVCSAPIKMLCGMCILTNPFKLNAVNSWSFIEHKWHIQTDKHTQTKGLKWKRKNTFYCT